MGELERAWQVAGQRDLFDEIHRYKSLYEDILYGVANRLMATGEAKELPGFRGCKVSKGNELEHCPYQVLDVGRDFDPESGFNIRVLHWWGRGTFVFLFIGYASPLYSSIWEDPAFGVLRANGYRRANANSLWHYKQILDEGSHEQLSKFSRSDLDSRSGRSFQIFRPVTLRGEKNDAEEELYECVHKLITVLRPGTLE